MNRAEKALRESESRYRDLVEYSEYLICTHDLKGQILSLNQGAAKNLGYDQSFLLKKNIRDFLSPEAKGGFDEYLRTILKDGAARRTMLVQTATGEKRVWEYNNTLRTEGVTEPIVRGMAHDITEHKRTEDERERLVKDLQKALAEIKHLSGLLPICSGCKKIRDDKGYWNQIEEYISAHSEATFSHGLCPECLKKLYPDL
jgi:PAS domain S-box-containing protein